MHVFDSFGGGNAMRGDDDRSEGFFSYVRLETRIREDHPLRAIRELVDTALLKLSPAFDRLYAREDGRRSRRSDCCERCCCRPSTRCVRSGN